MAKKLHWTQTPEGNRRLRIIRRRKPSPAEHEGEEEDKIHLLYMLPGLEMAASEILQRIDSIRRTLGQGPWNFKPQEVSSNSSPRNSHPPVETKKKRRITVAGMRKIRQAQKKRWETYHKEEVTERKPLSKAQLRAMKLNAAKARAALKAKQLQPRRQDQGRK